MPSPRIKPKWRPPLALIVHAVLLTVMTLPVLTVVWFRVVEAASGAMAPAELAALAVVLLLTLLVAYVLTRTLTIPIHALIERTDAIARGERAAIRPLDRYGTKEIAALSQSFLDLAGKLVDHSDYVRSFAAHVSHELKSPLTSIRGAAELLREDEAGAMSPAQRDRFLANIIADAQRLDALLSRLRELAKAEIPAASGRSAMQDIASTLRTRFPALTVTLDDAFSGAIALPGDAADIVFANLAENAVQHGATRLAIATADIGQAIAIHVSDDGRGIPEGNRARIFQPFFSTRRDEGGTGMGLAIVSAALSAHGGSIRLHETGGNGTSFEIVLPPAAM
ncbi:HAMP domain-containing histidine kinase [Rhizobiaceae bacterium BDR2-2]|uniref:Signal transduction histidine-protein kinase/phosphatase MprB n=1 Tax=Ectorhizobium quercum TaxID=2965071 RepID=A0AAE3MZF4_9HYPH|nr:HAMP domain-containing sensor histidine kinase [Ectorhizobium quercum]MCX8997918.1 HAMP domain-containing histidine kinase [Ectorhizobium quercum]